MAAADISAPDFKDAPYWWEAAPPSKAAVPAPPDRVEVAIVGAGYCGLAAALELIVGSYYRLRDWLERRLVA